MARVCSSYTASPLPFAGALANNDISKSALETSDLQAGRLAHLTALRAAPDFVEVPSWKVHTSILGASGALQEVIVH